MKKKVCLISDMHDAFDDRIYWKESVSLKNNGYDVTHLCVGDADQTQITEEGIKIVQIRRNSYFKNLILNKLYKTVFRKDIYARLYELAKQENATVYHIQDLQPNRIGTALKNLPWRPKLVFDVHEPFFLNLKDYNGNKSLIYKGIISLYALYMKSWQYRKARTYDLIIATEENVAQDFKLHVNTRTEIIYNYTNLPIPCECDKTIDVLYCGSITVYRGVMQILQAAELCAETLPNIRFLFIGNIWPAQLKDDMIRYIEDHNMKHTVSIHDAVPYHEIGQYYEKSKIGLGIFLPIPSYFIALPIKTFEYMHYGLPIVASNFGHINHYVVTEHAGLTVDPTDPAEIAEAILRLLSDENLYDACSRNGRMAAQNKYQWKTMETKLLALYRSLLASEF